MADVRVTIDTREVKAAIQALRREGPKAIAIERVAMVRHGIDDIRIFYENDLRFLEQFPG